MGRGHAAAESGNALVDRLAGALRSRVLAGEIPAGARLRQETLAADFGVSRTPVREALRKLEAIGLVRLEPHRGAVVRRLSAREIRDAYEVRAELEGLAARLAATRIRDEALRRLRDADRLFRNSIEAMVGRAKDPAAAGAPDGELRDWLRANDVFHETIQEASGNERLRGTIAHLHGSFPRNLTSVALSDSSRLLEENVAQHEAILTAIERHDPLEAGRLMKEHILRAGELITLRFEQTEGGSS
jgi:DNA-binding GntR family transcriptional regulator